MRGTGVWSDHRLVRSLVGLELPPPRCHQAIRWPKRTCQSYVRKICTRSFKNLISQRLQHPEQQTANISVEEQWTRIKEATYEATSETLGCATWKHKDPFDDRDAEAQDLLDAMHSTHLAWMRDKNCSVKKMAYTQARQKAQLRHRRMKNQWWNNKAAELHRATDRHHTGTFFHDLKAVCAPREASNRSTVSLSLTA